MDVGVVLCTLLGPEGPGLLATVVVGGSDLWTIAWCFFGGLGAVLRTLVFILLGVGGGYRPYFENYTVDASILDNTFGVVTYI